ncbi:mandelate racemase/muconate lactonizing enzyme family protein [Tepidibacter aestuarii]|uniref:mandelate racemase/muconate lactonizing enzyme family protein n=1 Tax=Tepidibacter aestuarii TaxID=2925782 RepID=UPI0020BFDFD7|nr:enolase C-terminal domain-like protein [Tepidibacter aestuarii]CAH2214706.1 L-Ala-D/L-Glu epimerase [Tepidibacter aestuarii]
MKILKIDIEHIKVPLKKVYNLSKAIGSIENTEPILVKIFTDEGLLGIGETNPFPHFTEETPETIKAIIKKYIGPSILGMNPLNIASIHKAMDSIIKGNYLSKAAIDIACYDIKGKYSNLPIHNLLQGRLREEIPIMWSLGSDLPEKNAEEAIKIKNQGYKSIMIKVGALSIFDDIERIKSIRDAVGKDYPLIVDANQGLDVNTAIKFAKKIEKYDISLLEQPVPYWDIAGMAKVRQNINIPVSADESLFTIHDAKVLIESKAVDVFSIKVSKHGGIYKAKQIMDLAKTYGIYCLMNSMIEEGITQAASLQLGASASNLWEFGHAYFSPLRLKEDITDYSNNIINGSIKINDKPGLGINAFDQIIEKYKVDEFTIS